MKYVIIASLTVVMLFLSHIDNYAQTKDQFNGKFQIGSVSPSTSFDFKLLAAFTYDGPKYGAGDIEPGDQIIDTNCRLYVVESITKTSPFVELEVSDPESPTVNPSRGVGVIFRPTAHNKLPLETSGLSESMKTCIANYLALSIDGIEGNGGGVETATIYYGMLDNAGSVSDATGLQSVADVTNGEYLSKADLTIAPADDSKYYTVLLPVGWRNPSFLIEDTPTMETLVPVNTLDIEGVKYMAWKTHVGIPESNALTIK